MNKRTISLGFKDPKALESRVIYVKFAPSGDKEIRASAVSDTPFRFTSRTLAGNIIHEEKTSASTYTGDVERGWERPYQDFLLELIGLNDGEIVFNRLIDEGASDYRAMEMLVAALREFNQRTSGKPQE